MSRYVARATIAQRRS